MMDLDAIWAQTLALLPDRPERCLFRSTEGFNLARVREGGTDRHGRTPGPDWDQGAGLAARYAFDAVLFASTAAEIAAALAARAPGAPIGSALGKCPETPDPHLLVYRRAAFVRVAPRQYAFRRDEVGFRRAALRALFAVGPAGVVAVPLDGPAGDD